MDKTSIDRLFGYYDEKHQEVIFCCNKAKEEDASYYDGQTISDETLKQNNEYGIVYNIRLKTWTVREMGVTALGKVKLLKDARIDDVHTEIDKTNVMIDAAVYAGAKVYTLAGDKDGNLYTMSGNEDTRKPQDGYEGYVISKTHHMEEPGKIKRLMRIQFHIETAPKQYDEHGDETEGYNLYCQVGSAWNPENRNEGDIEWTEKRYLNLKKNVVDYSKHIVPYIDFDISARYFVLRFGTTKNNTYFKVLGYTLYYQVRGDE